MTRMASSHDPLGIPTLVDLLRRWADERPERQVYTFLADGESAEVSLTYAELDRWARAIAATLQEWGTPGERAIIFCPPGLDYVAALFGCLYAGAVAVPAFPPRANRPVPRLEAIVADARATVALATKAVLSNVAPGKSQATPLDNLRWLAVDDLPPGVEAGWRENMRAPDQPAILQYTSGSTTTPRGVVLSLSNVMHNLASIRQALKITPEDIGVSWLPSYHDMGLIGGILEPLFVEGRGILMPPTAFLQRPLRWLQAISHYRGTIATGPNFAYELCANRIGPEQREELDLNSWRIALCGAEPIRAQTLERFAATFAPCGFRREAFHPCYGLAEATLLVSGGKAAARYATCTVSRNALSEGRVVEAQVEDTATQALVSSGQVAGDQEVAIVNPKTLARCAPDEVGEIWVMGPNVSQEYWQRPDETERTFRAYISNGDAGPFLRTGDLGFLREGELFVTGRLKDLIIIRGRNLYPHDIELTVERSHAGLRPGMGAAFAVEAENEERLVVVQELDRYARSADADEIIAAICEAVAIEHELLPYAVVLLKTGSIPATSSGKVQRFACREGFMAGTLNVSKEWRQKLDDGPHQALPGIEAGEAQDRSGQVQATKEERVHPLLGKRLRSAQIIFEADLSAQSPAYLDDHRVEGAVVLPAAAYVEIALAAAIQALGPGPHTLRQLELQKWLGLPESGSRTVQVTLSPDTPGEKRFQLHSFTGSAGQAQEEWTLHATGKIQAASGDPSPPMPDSSVEEIQARCPEQISGRNIYRKLREQGFQYGLTFQVIGWLWRRDGEALGQLQVPRTQKPEMELYQVHPAILEAAFQVLGATLPASTARGGGLLLPTGIGSVQVYGLPGNHLLAHARLQSGVEGNSNLAEGDVRLLDEDGRVLVEVQGLRLQFLGRAAQPDAETSGALTREALFAVEPERRQQWLETYLQVELARVLEIEPSHLQPHVPLRSLGLDSLLAIELKSRIEASLGVRLPMMSLFDEPTISMLAKQLLHLLGKTSSDSSPTIEPESDP
jgi:acyl-CoA synthetase (AMP-forming)/AMP-acid ligase II/acyl carrier protein